MQRRLLTAAACGGSTGGRRTFSPDGPDRRGGRRGLGGHLFDPIFQGLAISLMAGEVASLALSRMVVPVLYYVARRKELARVPRTCPAPRLLSFSLDIHDGSFLRKERL